MKDTDEDWRDIPGFAGIYEVSSLGRVRSKKTGLIKSQRLRNGYWCLDLYKNGKRSTLDVHRLVAFAFHGLPEEPWHICDHRDGYGTHNNEKNLRWLRRKENQYNQPYTRYLKKLLEQSGIKYEREDTFASI